MVRNLVRSQTFDILIDDDRSGEAADLVGIRVERGDIFVTLVHCRYSSRAEPGGRLADLYEVYGQAMRGARWRDNGGLALLEHLDRRVLPTVALDLVSAVCRCSRDSCKGQRARQLGRAHDV